MLPTYSLSSRVFFYFLFCGFTFMGFAVDSQFLFAQNAAISDVEDGNSDSVPLPAEAKTAEELFEFIDGLGEMEPEGKSDEEVIVHQRKIFRTARNAADKILTMDITDDQAVEATFYKLQAMQYLRELGEPGAAEQFSKAIDVAVSDHRPKVTEIGMKFKIEMGFNMWGKLNDAQRNEVVDALIQFILKGTPDESKLQMITSVVEYIGDAGGAAQAKRLLDAAIPLFENAQNPELQEYVPALKGMARRMALPGNPIVLEGTLLDGSQFDWSSYRGKVVLVDFWATWCGPCLAEIPNMLKLYEQYHDKGFDVVGISLDSKREDTENTIKEMGIPWVTLFNHEETQRGWDHPIAAYYGIQGIPRAILVDQQGNVVTMLARGPNLERQLKRLLGEPQAGVDASDSSQAVEAAKPVVNE